MLAKSFGNILILTDIFIRIEKTPGVTYCRAAICHIPKLILLLYNSIRPIDFNDGSMGDKRVYQTEGEQVVQITCWKHSVSIAD